MILLIGSDLIMNGCISGREVSHDAADHHALRQLIIRHDPVHDLDPGQEAVPEPRSHRRSRYC